MKRSLVSPELAGASAVIRRELREEAEEAERDAAALAAMGRTMAEVAHELMQRGDLVRASCGHVSFVGRISRAGVDYFSLDSDCGRVDLGSKAVSLSLLSRATRGGRAPSRSDAPSLRARLLELRMEHARVRVGLSGEAPPVEGRIETVGADHVGLDCGDGERWWVPLGAVAFVVEAEGAR